MARKEFNPDVYTGFRGAIELPHSIRTYFDGFASEYNSISEEKKLLDLGYVLQRGYDLEAQIKACLFDRPHIGSDDFKHAFGTLIEYLDSDYMRMNGYDKYITDYEYGDLVSILRNLLDEHYIEYNITTNPSRELI
ncbi:MAG: hypothetical protein NC453_30435 [Muribaculum sp.]|nr:hypothetical protein [Muribaculum sp.]